MSLTTTELNTLREVARKGTVKAHLNTGRISQLIMLYERGLLVTGCDEQHKVHFMVSLKGDRYIQLHEKRGGTNE